MVSHIYLRIRMVQGYKHSKGLMSKSGQGFYIWRIGMNRKIMVIGIMVRDGVLV